MMASSSSHTQHSLLGLSHDVLRLIETHLMNPLAPCSALALASACHAVRAPLQQQVVLLKERHQTAKELYAPA